MRFVLVDRFIELELGRRAVGTKTFLPSEDFFADHFPGFPIVPGVLLAETMIQTGGWLILCTLSFSKWPFLSMIDKAKFRSFVRPGENLRIEAVLESATESNFQARTSVQVEDRRVAEARIFYHCRENAADAPDAIPVHLHSWAKERFQQLAGHLTSKGTPRL